MLEKVGIQKKIASVSTILAEVSKVGKDKRNGDSTDQEAIAVFKKTVASNKETMSRLEPDMAGYVDLEAENAFIEALLPTQLSEKDLGFIIDNIIGVTGQGITLGQVMQVLKNNLEGTYDGKLASAIAKQRLETKS